MNFKKTKYLFAVLAVSLVFWAAECHGKTTRPETGKFDYRRIKLANGLEVITLEDFSCPIVAVQIWYHVGSKDEQPGRHGFAHMFEHMMFRGTDKLGPTDHFAYIHRVGGTTNGNTGFDRTVYHQTLPAKQLELALWLEAERMTFLKIDQESFDTERKVVEEERRMDLNQPYGTIYEKLLAEIFKVHPYSWPPIGNIPDLRAASVQELRDFWKKYYVPNNATLIIVGAVKHKDAQKLAKRYFGWIPRYDEPPRVTVKEPEPTEKRTVTLKEENAPAPATGVVYRTVPVCDKNSVAVDLLAEILGGGKSSRLYRELVAEKQLAVGAQAVSWSLKQDGLFGAGAAMTPFSGDANNVLEIIERHISKLRNEAVSEREMMKARNQMLRGLVTENLEIESKANMLGNAAVEYGDVSQVNRWIDDIRKVTAADIQRTANEYLTDKRALEVKVDRNLPGAVSGMLGIAKEEEGVITAEPEKVSPKPGRGELTRPKNWSKEAPVAKVAAAKLTPKYSSKKLKNGLKVLVVPNHEVPFVSIQLGLLPGAWTESKPGTAAMTMQMLVKGTSKHSEGELADELETYAISLSGGCDMDTGTVNASCLTEYTGRTMGLLGEVVLTPSFPEEEFEKLRKQVLTTLAVSSAEPEYVADREFRRKLYGEHPYSRTATGEVEDVNALAIEDLKQWWSKFARPDTAVLIFSGDIEAKEAFELAKKTFGDWKATGERPNIKISSPTAAAETHIYLVDMPGSTQSQIRVGQRGITRHDDGYFVSRIVSSYFGWGFDSRLNESIRVAKGLTYGVWGSYIANRFAGEFEVGTFSKTESTAEAVRAVLEEINRLKTEGPSDDELENNRSYILGSFVRGRETPQQIAGDLWLIESQGLGQDYLERLLRGITKAKRADCEHLVRETIEPGKLVIVVAGEAGKLKEGLEKIAPVTVVKKESL
ncbi:MAG: pitrilysin family protein [Phycisphaerae bacterium]|nr:pitrilysin family protein [Phycisphaerae bacterium]MDD5380064.1 pitrilysin family protein [Phycisphaerae bacterium]